MRSPNPTLTPQLVSLLTNTTLAPKHVAKSTTLQLQTLPRALTKNLTTRPHQHTSTRPFTTSPTLRSSGSNRIYTSIRAPADLQTLLLLSSSSHQPLLTLWTASWAPSSSRTLSLLTSLIQDQGIGENVPVSSADPSAVSLNAASGTMNGGTGVGFVEVEADAPDVLDEDLVGRYMVYKVPMLMAFSRGEAQMETRVSDEGQLQDVEFLRGWIEKEAARGGAGGAGGSLLGKRWSGWFGGS